MESDLWGDSPCNILIVYNFWLLGRYGESKKTDTLVDHGVNCYSSSDLGGPWRFEGQVVVYLWCCLLSFSSYINSSAPRKSLLSHTHTHTHTLSLSLSVRNIHIYHGRSFLSRTLLCKGIQAPLWWSVRKFCITTRPSCSCSGSI